MNLAQFVSSRAIILQTKKITHLFIKPCFLMWQKKFMKTIVSSQQGDDGHVCNNELALELFCSQIVF